MEETLRALDRATPTSLPCAPAAGVSDGGARVWTARAVLASTPGLSVCALRLACARARADGAGPITVVTLASDGALELCGLCRQTLRELAPGARVLHVGSSGEAREIAIDAALPEPFVRFERGA